MPLLKITFYVQYYSVLSSPTTHNSVNGVNLYNILDLNDNFDIKVVELGISLGLYQQTASIKAFEICTREVIFLLLIFFQLSQYL